MNNEKKYRKTIEWGRLEISSRKIRRGGKNTWKNYTKKKKKHKTPNFNNLDNHNGVINHQEPDILESKIKWALGSYQYEHSGGDGMPAELFQVLKDDAVKVLHSIRQQIWKT